MKLMEHITKAVTISACISFAASIEIGGDNKLVSHQKWNQTMESVPIGEQLLSAVNTAEGARSAASVNNQGLEKIDTNNRHLQKIGDRLMSFLGEGDDTEEVLDGYPGDSDESSNVDAEKAGFGSHLAKKLKDLWKHEGSSESSDDADADDDDDDDDEDNEDRDGYSDIDSLQQAAPPQYEESDNGKTIPDYHDNQYETYDALAIDDSRVREGDDEEEDPDHISDEAYQRTREGEEDEDQAEEGDYEDSERAGEGNSDYEDSHIVSVIGKDKDVKVKLKGGAELRSDFINQDPSEEIPFAKVRLYEAANNVIWDVMMKNFTVGSSKYYESTGVSVQSSQFLAFMAILILLPVIS